MPDGEGAGQVRAFGPNGGAAYRCYLSSWGLYGPELFASQLLE